MTCVSAALMFRIASSDQVGGRGRGGGGSWQARSSVKLWQITPLVLDEIPLFPYPYFHKAVIIVDTLLLCLSLNKMQTLEPFLAVSVSIPIDSLKQGESCSSPRSPGGIPKDKHFSTEHLFYKNGGKKNPSFTSWIEESVVIIGRGLALLNKTKKKDITDTLFS